MYFSLHCKFCEWEGGGEWTKTPIYWPPLLWPSALCPSRSPDSQPEAWGLSFLMSAGFFYHILSLTVLQNYWGPRGTPLLGDGFPYHILSPTRLISNSVGDPEGPLHRAVAFSTTTCLRLFSPQLPDFLSSLSYIIVQSPTQSPTQSLEWHVWSSSSGNNCHAV